MSAGGCKKDPPKEKDVAPMESSSQKSPTPGAPLTDEAARDKALALVGNLAAGKLDDVVATFDETMSQTFNKEKVAETWKELVEQSGSYKAAAFSQIEHKETYLRAIVTAEFEKTKLDLVIVYERHGKVIGFFVKPYTAPWIAPTYAKADAFTEEEFTVGEGALALPGTLTLPKVSAATKHAAIVLVHGSGPNDRDETVGSTKPFKDLAWGLAARGIAVLRYEKVSKAHAFQVTKWGDKVTLGRETLADAMTAVSLLRAHARIDPKKIVYLGHSQGALAAPRAGKSDPALAGLIMMAGPTRPLEDVSLAQFEYIATLPGANGEGAKKALPAMREAVKLVKSPTLDAKTPKAALPLGIPAPFWLDLRGYQPEQVAASLTMPVLVLQGEADYQIDMTDFAGWKKALAKKANATLKSYPGLFHSFGDCGCKLATPDDYAKPANVSVQVIDDIEKWVKAL
jgi:dienelactone hydrolase